MDQSQFNESNVEAYDSEVEFNLGHVEQLLVILGFLFCVLGCFLYIIFKTEKKSQRRRQRSGQMRVNPSPQLAGR
jgi:hypothetical protein